MNRTFLETATPFPTAGTTRGREWHAHAAAYYALSIGLVAAWKGHADRWDALVLGAALAAALIVARKWVFLSRVVLAGMAGAALSYWASASVTERGSVAANVGDALGSSQGQILLMSGLTLSSTFAAGWAFWRASAGASRLATRLTTAATAVGFSAILVRWFESYQAGVGHIPISNLYEVFVLFIVITGSIQLVVQRDARLGALGPFFSMAPSAAVVFLLWYGTSRAAYELQPLVPALDSYWMKLHVPANFIGYGAFCLAAMVAAASLLTRFGAVARRLPDSGVLDSLMHRLIAVGFVFFTVATVLGALWAAEAWGGYWSWDPKETWALVVWLNYGAWLHFRLVKGYRGPVVAWWALGGLLVTLFAFLGVNMYLSGLHSYGGL